MLKKILFALIITLLPRIAAAKATQFYLEDKVAPDLKARIYLVADVKAQTPVQNALYRAVDQARNHYKKYQKELSGIAQRGDFLVSPESAALVETALQWAKKTGGAFDIAFGPYRKNYEKVKVNRGKGIVSLKADGIQLNLENIRQGALADAIAKSLNEDGWNDYLVKIGAIFVARGNDVFGPWKIPVMRPTNALASHMLFYKAEGEVGAATYPKSNKQNVAIDPRNNSIVNPDIASATIFGVDGAEAEALSAALYVMGESEAKKFLSKNKRYRAVLGNLDGKYTHIPDLGRPSKSKENKIVHNKKPPKISTLKEAPKEKVEADQILQTLEERVKKQTPERVHSTRSTL